MFFKDPYDILIEACKSECGECDDLIEDEVEQELEDEVSEVEELEDDIEYDEEMVPVIQKNVEDSEDIEDYEEGYRYLVEMDCLAKYMESSKEEDPLKALEKIAQVNNLKESAMCIVIESDDYIRELIEESKQAKKKTGSSHKLNKLASSAKLLKDIKNKGIKVLKKKSKKK